MRKSSLVVKRVEVVRDGILFSRNWISRLSGHGDSMLDAI